jgi:hypothetical protein
MTPTQKIQAEITLLNNKAAGFDTQEDDMRALAAQATAANNATVAAAYNARADYYAAEATAARAKATKLTAQLADVQIDETVDNARRAVIVALRAEADAAFAAENAAVAPIEAMEADQAARLLALLNTFAAERAAAGSAWTNYQAKRQAAAVARNAGQDALEEAYTEIAGRHPDATYEIGFGRDAVARAEAFKNGLHFPNLPSRESLGGMWALIKVVEQFFGKRFV